MPTETLPKTNTAQLLTETLPETNITQIPTEILPKPCQKQTPHRADWLLVLWVCANIWTGCLSPGAVGALSVCKHLNWMSISRSCWCFECVQTFELDVYLQELLVLWVCANIWTGCLSPGAVGALSVCKHLNWMSISRSCWCFECVQTFELDVYLQELLVLWVCANIWTGCLSPGAVGALSVCKHLNWMSVSGSCWCFECVQTFELDVCLQELLVLWVCANIWTGCLSPGAVGALSVCKHLNWMSVSRSCWCFECVQTFELDVYLQELLVLWVCANIWTGCLSPGAVGALSVCKHLNWMSVSRSCWCFECVQTFELDVCLQELLVLWVCANIWTGCLSPGELSRRKQCCRLHFLLRMINFSTPPPSTPPPPPHPPTSNKNTGYPPGITSADACHVHLPLHLSVSVLCAVPWGWIAAV